MLKRLLLRNFRNYEQEEVVFSPHVNLILGKNGQGKTNLLEAIHFISTGRAFRTSALSDLISFGKTFFYLEAEFDKNGVSQCIKIYYDENTRRVQYNETVNPTLTSLLGILPSVLISPYDMSIISGSPSERRRFLDIHIAQTDPLYVYHLGRYFKAMKQRNYLLRTKNEKTIQAWEHAMALSASYLMLKRDGAITALKSSLLKWTEILSCGLDSVQILYEPSQSFSSDPKHLTLQLLQGWEKNRLKELSLGATQSGPHRDDFSIYLEEKPAKVFSSEGQKRSCISALRFAQWELMEETLAQPPLLGIDDFGIQLDSHRQTLLKEHLLKFHQVFLTSPNGLSEMESFHTLTIESGKAYSSTYLR